VVWAELSMTSVRGPDGGVRRLVHVDDVGARRAARLALEAERTWLAGLVALQREVTALFGDRDAVVARVIAGALELVAEADGAVVALWTDPTDPGRGLDCVAAGGCLDYAVGTHLEVDGSITEAVALGDRAVRVDDVRDDDRLDPDLQRRVGTGATVLAPLLVDGATLGILSTCSRSPGAFDDHVLNLVTMLAHSLAGALRVAEDQRRLADAVELATQRAQAIELASDAVVVRDLDGYVVYWSPSAEQLYGWRPDEALGRDLDELLDTRTSDGGPLNVVRTALREHGTWEGELLHRSRDGRVVTVQTRKALQRDRHGRAVAILTINTDVTARRRAQRELAEHLEQLADDDRLKTDLIAMLGHEINNPLSVLSGALDALQLAAPDRATGRQVLELDPASVLPMMRRSVDRMRLTVREILARVTAEAGQLVARPQPVAVAAVVQDLLAALGREVEVVGDLEAVALVQPEHLEQVAANLLTNADKYAGGLARVRVSTQGATVTLAFEDDGPGVPPGFAPQLFERFARAEGASGTRGTGIGLFICRELARANGGDLVHRAGEGGGSVFLLELSRNDDGREDCRQG
jgi:PAS domain S-box-containing protein